MPLVLIGAGANRKNARSALDDFIHTTRLAFFNTQMGKGVVDERSDLSGDTVDSYFLGAKANLQIGKDSCSAMPELKLPNLRPNQADLRMVGDRHGFEFGQCG